MPVNVCRTRILAERIRLESMRCMASEGCGHVGGVLSAAELAAVLYEDVLTCFPSDPGRMDRDRVVLSKGHCGPVLYAALALKGFFPLEELTTLNRNGTRLPSHCNCLDTPGIDISTGSLGQGASLAAGIALGMRLKGLSRYTYLILGDGECDEGQVWEAALFAAHFKLGNLVAFVDRNRQQLDGYTCDVMDVGDLEEKFRAFGWHAQTVDGHDVRAIYDAVEAAKGEARPSAIVLETVKGKGWSVSEGKPNVHHLKISEEQFALAEREISARIGEIEANDDGV